MEERAIAEKRFKNHIAEFRDLGEIQILDWKKPGTREYGVRYIFDRTGGTITISGDLGWAVVCPTGKCDLQTSAKCFNVVGYFAEKIKASSGLYYYDEDKAREELRERLENMDSSEREDLINRILDGFTAYYGVRMLDDDTYNDLNRVDRDAFEWLDGLGRAYDIQVYLWMYGMEFAWRQVEFKKNPELHVEIGISTAHLTQEAIELLDRCSGDYDWSVGTIPDVVAYRKEGYGWWVTCFEDPDETLPDSLRACILFAKKNGANWIMFDGDATKYAELPIY